MLRCFLRWFTTNHNSADGLIYCPFKTSDITPFIIVACGRFSSHRAHDCTLIHFKLKISSVIAPASYIHTLIADINEQWWLYIFLNTLCSIRVYLYNTVRYRRYVCKVNQSYSLFFFCIMLFIELIWHGRVISPCVNVTDWMKRSPITGLIL